MGTFKQLTAADGHRFDAYCAEPLGSAKGGVVVLQEAFGVNGHIRDVCDDYAARGYNVFAPALYDRQQRNAAFGYDESGLEGARALRRGLNYADALLDIGAVVAELRERGSVFAVGYCVGGSAAWLAACRLNIDAASCYYASDIGKELDEQPRCPVIMHFAERDHFIPISTVEQFRIRHPNVPTFVYPADHGFNCSDRPQGYDAASADRALERTLALFSDSRSRMGVG